MSFMSTSWVGPPWTHDIHKRTVRKLVKLVYARPLINNAERGAYVEHMIVLALEGEGWDLTWPWASWDLQHQEDGARIEVKQSAARQTWHERPDSEPLPPPARGRLGIQKPNEGYYLEDGRYQKTTLPQRHADIYVFAWHPVTCLRNADRRLRADHRRPDQWKFFVAPEKCLPYKNGITPKQLERCDYAVRCDYKELAENVTEVLKSLPKDSLKAVRDAAR